MGDDEKTPLKLDFDSKVRVEFRGATITSDAGLLACRELDDALSLTDSADEFLKESRTGKNILHQLIPLLRQSVYSRLAGYDDTNDADRLSQARIHRWTGMDGVRTAEGGEGVTGAMIRARIWVDGRLAGGLQALLGAPMAAYSGCGERDGGIGHGKRRSRTGLARVCGDVGLLAGQWRTGAVRLGVEWLAVGPGRG